MRLVLGYDIEDKWRFEEISKYGAVTGRLTMSHGFSTASLRKWLRLLPYSFTGADRAAGYRYDISEFSLTQVLDRPVQGRLFFEQVIRENLDLGRPEKGA